MSSSLVMVFIHSIKVKMLFLSFINAFYLLKNTQANGYKTKKRVLDTEDTLLGVNDSPHKKQKVFLKELECLNQHSQYFQTNPTIIPDQLDEEQIEDRYRMSISHLTKLPTPIIMAFTPNSMDQSRKYHVFDDSYYEKYIQGFDFFQLLCRK
ncbi:hypothetical protein DICPUDRAFT_77802 [Dictyostelium purpureum]|uniref:Uncharacterized protein n=1 Tax=Dictyostelium purpureum TaxID=5786 RepID=F0ZHN8_DICPU|nr:uncharacterized protein DICPUDRAFT_77802 [Dictyostelium purpureum]EGC36564.1 hypothetical protein DICPUDRAFT_77802 [Dictyostelium purpureum]|eukprot:XP_003286936.1 hypothetical protein DICPUDRAFT_77802 [Dictyostelium purpureum]